METAQFGVVLAHYSSQGERPVSGFEVVTVVRRLAKEEHSAALAQLVSRTSAIMKFGAGAGVDPSVTVKGLITDLINRLQAEGSPQASHKSYCDAETSKATEISRPMLGSNLPKLEAAVARSTVLDGARQGPDRARRRSPRLSNAVNDCAMLLQSLEDQLAQDNEALKKVKADLFAAKITDLADALFRTGGCLGEGKKR